MHNIKFSGKRQPSVFNSLGSIVLPSATTEEIKIANFSDQYGNAVVQNWLSPNSLLVSPDGKFLRDKAQADVKWETYPADLQIPISSPNYFTPTGGETLTAGAAVSQSKRAFTFVAKLSGAGVILGTERNSVSSAGSVAIGASGILTGAGGGGTNSVDNAGDLTDVDVLVTVCFSTERGVTIRRDGVETYRDDQKTIENLGDQLRFFSTGTSELSRFSGKCGPIFYCSQDLSVYEKLPALKYIERFADVDLT